MMRYRSRSLGTKSRKSLPEPGLPWRAKSTGASFGPASRSARRTGAPSALDAAAPVLVRAATSMKAKPGRASTGTSAIVCMRIHEAMRASP